MLAIKSIEIVDIEEKQIQISHIQNHSDMPVRNARGKLEPMEMTMVHEILQGKTFVLPDGRELCIGMSKRVQDAIGLPLEVFNNMEVAIDVLRISVNSWKGASEDKTRQIEAFNNAGFWKRLKYLFKGGKP